MHKTGQDTFIDSATPTADTPASRIRVSPDVPNAHEIARQVGATIHRLSHHVSQLQAQATHIDSDGEPHAAARKMLLARDVRTLLGDMQTAETKLRHLRGDE